MQTFLLRLSVCALAKSPVLQNHQTDAKNDGACGKNRGEADFSTPVDFTIITLAIKKLAILVKVLAELNVPCDIISDSVDSLWP